MMQDSIRYRQGDVVYISFPYSDNPANGKTRPAVIISSTKYNQGKTEFIFAAITSQIPSVLSDDEINLTPADLSNAGLEYDCIIKSGKVFTLNKRLIKRKFGFLSIGTKTKLINKIMAILDESGVNRSIN